MTCPSLSSLGLTAFHTDALHALGLPFPCVPSRVVRAQGAWLTVLGDHPETAISRRLRRSDPLPVVGDWVAHDRAEGLARAVLPRRTFFARKAAGRSSERQAIAANVDLALVVMGLVGDFSVRRLERYLTLVHASGALPAVLLTKAGLVADGAQRLQEARAVAPGCEVHLLDLPTGVGDEALRTLLRPGSTAVLLGSSGVGKSTIANHLLGYAAEATNTVRAHDGRGRHTTTRRELFLTPGNFALIDTPGMRELSLDAGQEDVDATFDEVASFSAACRFRDCQHRAEPGCGVLAALAAGEVREDRVASFHALSAEASRQDRRRADHEARARGRAGSLAVREALRRKGRLLWQVPLRSTRPGGRPRAYASSRPRSASKAAAALWPPQPMTEPAGWVPALAE